MGKAKSPKTPKTPDYLGAAKEQGKQNRLSAEQSARLSNPNIVGPGGSQRITWNGDQATIRQTLSEDNQRLYDQGNQGRLGASDAMLAGQDELTDTYGSEFDTSYLPAQQVDAGQTGQDAIMSRLDPQIQRDRDRLATRLANQGIVQGSEAWNDAMNTQGQKENDLRMQAALYGINVGQQARQQSLNEGLTLRGLPLREYAGLFALSQGEMPQFQGYSGAQVQPGDYQGAVQARGDFQVDRYNAQAAGASSAQQGLFGLGSALITKYSDRRLKRDIEPVGTLNGFNLYSYRYVWSDNVEVGVMADEVEQLMPQAVTQDAHGYKQVNYSMLGL